MSLPGALASLHQLDAGLQALSFKNVLPLPLILLYAPVEVREELSVVSPLWVSGLKLKVRLGSRHAYPLSHPAQPSSRENPEFVLQEESPAFWD